MKALRSSRSSATGYALWLSRRDQPKLGGSREPLDAGLLAKRGKAIGDRDHDCELNRAPTACIAAGRAGTVGSQTPLDVGGPAAIQGAIGAVQQVDAGHPLKFAGATTVPALRGVRRSRPATVPGRGAG